MAANHKLTGVLRGRTVTGGSSHGSTLSLTFDDGSTMTVKAARDYQDLTAGTVKAVRQAGTRLNLDFTDGSTLELETTEPTSSVMVRDRSGKLEYAD